MLFCQCSPTLRFGNVSRSFLAHRTFIPSSVVWSPSKFATTMKLCVGVNITFNGGLSQTSEKSVDC